MCSQLSYRAFYHQENGKMFGFGLCLMGIGDLRKAHKRLSWEEHTGKLFRHSREKKVFISI
jgi:hypothetical protein